MPVSGTSRRRGVVLWLVAVSALSLLARSPWSYALRSSLMHYLGWEASAFSWGELLSAYVLSLAFSYPIQRIVDHYLLLDKSDQSLSGALILMSSFVLMLHTPWPYWGLILVYAGGVMLLFQSYQRRRMGSSMLITGLLLGVGSYFNAKVLLLLPLIIAIMYRQRCLSLRHALSLVHGLVLYALSAFALLGIELGSERLAEWSVQWSAWESIPMSSALGSYGWLAFVLMLIGSLAIALFASGGGGQSVRQIEQLQSLMYILIAGIVLTIFDSYGAFFFAAMLPMPVSVFTTRAIGRLRSVQQQRVAVGLVMILLFIILVLF